MRKKQKPKYAILDISTYSGGKDGAGIPQKLINQIPPHETYICGFLGHDAILRYKKPAKINIGYELDTNTLATWSRVKFLTDSLNWNNLDLYNVSFLCFNPLDDIFQTQSTFLYLDPPYPISSRMQKKKIYKHEMTDDQHYQLLQKVKRCKCRVAISTYKNEMYEKELKGWRCIKYKTTTRGATVTEYLYMNYPALNKLHDASYFGNNKRERELIKKRFTTFKKRMIEMNVIERSHYLEFIKEQYGLVEIK